MNNYKINNAQQADYSQQEEDAAKKLYTNKIERDFYTRFDEVQTRQNCYEAEINGKERYEKSMQEHFNIRFDEVRLFNENFIQNLNNAQKNTLK